MHLKSHLDQCSRLAQSLSTVVAIHGTTYVIKVLIQCKEAGSQAAIHGMRSVLQDGQTEAELLVDSTNAFNSLKSPAALQNIYHLCSSLATVSMNTYREDIQLFIDGETLLSREGMTQGDPLAMAMYAIGILPLINQLQSTDAIQVWFANDATAGGRLEQLHGW